jgi:hypothetical protein
LKLCPAPEAASHSAKETIMTALRVVRFAGATAMLLCLIAGSFGYSEQIKLTVAAAGAGSALLIWKFGHIKV